MSRDDQFAGFAKMLWQELYHEIDWQQDSGENAEQIIAQRVHDLVAHAIENADYSGIEGWIEGKNIPLFHKVVQSIPDMIEWPEETNK